jgi:ABC-type multidrug transport system ATPase subunit
VPIPHLAASADTAATGPSPDDRVRVPGALGVSVRGVVKAFGDVRAVDGLDLDVRAGTCLGLLGANGAGKSTTMRLLTAQAVADEGTIEVLGLPVPEQSKQARAAMGVVPQQDNLDIELTVRQNLQVFARLYRLPRAERPAAVQRALEVAQLTGRADTKVDDLSGGMRRRLLIARALVHRPRLVLLDEPTVGLDPQVRQELWALVDALRSEGVTVLMSTHYIEEAERLADDVAVMAAGRVIAFGTPSSLVAEHAGRQVLEVYGPPARLLEVEQAAAAAGLPSRRTGPAVAVLRADHAPDSLLAALPDAVRRPASLEDVFVLLTGAKVE